MHRNHGTHCLPLLLIAALGVVPTGCASRSDLEPSPRVTSETLPSWNDGPAKQAIIEFVDRVTDPASPDHVPEPERFAVFDNDGCLWSEQPMYTQLLFAFDRVEAMAADHPEWATQQPFRAVLEDDREALAAAGEEGLLQIVAATHAGMTTAEFEAIASDWIETARHPTTGRRFTEMVYQPMLELLDYLRDHGFETYIVSGGGVEFMRPWTEAVYGIPPEQVVGSRLAVEYRVRNGEPELVRLPEIAFNDDKEGKPVGIHTRLGRRPIAAFGNSDGDFQMLEWTTSGAGARLGVIIHHTDGEREWAYDRDSHIGRLGRGLDEAQARGWVVVDMKEEWRCIFP